MPEKENRRQRKQELAEQRERKKLKNKRGEVLFSSELEESDILHTLRTLQAPTIKRAGWILDPNNRHPFIDNSVADPQGIVDLLKSEKPAKKFQHTKEFSQHAAVRDFLTLQKLDTKQKGKAKRLAHMRAIKGFSLLEDIVTTQSECFSDEVSTRDTHKVNTFRDIYGMGYYQTQFYRRKPKQVLQLIDVVAKEIGKKTEEGKDRYSHELKLRLWAETIAFAQVYFVQDPKEQEKSKYFIRDQVLLYGIIIFREHGQHEIFEYIEAQRTAQSLHQPQIIYERKKK